MQLSLDPKQKIVLWVSSFDCCVHFMSFSVTMSMYDIDYCFISDTSTVLNVVTDKSFISAVDDTTLSGLQGCIVIVDLLSIIDN